jgi:NAD(P)-dependent dehydrogenase (short-subunit alcohol dehydrogenase family)
MTAQDKVALVVGAQGVIGRNLIEYLATLDDLLDAADTCIKLGALGSVTHLFYAAYQDRATWAELVPPNLTMLTNVVDAIEAASSNLVHIDLPPVLVRSTVRVRG